MSIDQTNPDNDSRAPLGGDEIVDEHALAAELGVSASELRAMASGQTEVPPRLAPFLPKPQRETRLVWRREDVEGLGERVREVTEAEQKRQSELLEQQRRQQREDDMYTQQRIRRAQQAEDAHVYALPVDDVHLGDLPVTREEHTGFWAGLKMAWRQFMSHEDDTPERTIVDATDGVPLASAESSTAREASESRRGMSAERRAERAARKAEQASTKSADLGEKARAKAESRAERDESATVKAQAQAESREARQQQKTAAREAKEQQKEAARAARVKAQEDKAAQKQGVKAAGESASVEKTELRERKKQVEAEKRVAAKAAKVAAAETAKLAKVEARDHKKRANDAKRDRLVRYKEKMARWKEDVKVAKANGVTPPRRPKRPRNNSDKPKPIDVVNAVRAFATMLDNSPGELESLDTMLREYEGTQIGEAFRRIHFRMHEQNATLVQAFAPEKMFPAEVHNMLRVGAKTISPGPALRVAVKLMDSSNDSKRKLRSQIMEPATVGVMSLVALFATAWFVMPTFVDMYDALDMPVPGVSAAILVMSDVTAYILAGFAVVVTGYAIWWFAYGRRWDRWRTTLDAYKLRMPLMGKANQAQETYHVLKVLHSYMSVGSPEREALADAAEATQNRAVRKHLETTAEMMIQGRTTFAGTFDSELFPNMVRNIVATAERSGRVEETIKSLEETYEREAEVEQQQAVARVTGTVAGISSLIFTVVVTMVTVPPLEMFGSTLSYGQ